VNEELIKRLRAAGEIMVAVSAHECISPYEDGELSKRLTEAADRITALEAEKERLGREVQKQRSLRDQYRAAWEAEKARAALGDEA
jgi:hypothetical protein